MTLLDRYLGYLARERNASSHTVEAYRRDIQEFVRRVIGDKPDFDDWKAVDVDLARRFVVALHEAGDSKRSMQRKRSALRSFFRFLVRAEEVSSNPFLKLAPIKADQPLPQVMSVNQIDLLTRAVPEFWRNAEANGIAKSEESAKFASARDLALVEAIYSGGLRISEAIGLNLGDVDLIGGVAKVRGSVAGCAISSCRAAPCRQCVKNFCAQKRISDRAHRASFAAHAGSESAFLSEVGAAHSGNGNLSRAL